MQNVLVEDPERGDLIKETAFCVNWSRRYESMDKTLFEDLVSSLGEAKAIFKGKASASRRFVLPAPDAKAVREQTGLSQSEFARLMRVSIKMLQNWEQHRRNPMGPAAALLKIVSTAPDVALIWLHT